MRAVNEDEILELLNKHRFLTGSELHSRLPSDIFDLWRSCALSERVSTRVFSRRYLRLDKALDAFARLSPSIMREFLTYTLIGKTEDRREMEKEADRRIEKIRSISRAKRELAFHTLQEVLSELDEEDVILENTCFIIAGDVVYDMAHTEQRPEKSTGKMVRGSDLDVIIVHEDSLDERVVAALDDAIYRRKYVMLVHPSLREELDYIIKSLNKTRGQMAFDTFQSMVACKILDEGQYLLGSEPLFRAIKSMLDETGVPERLGALRKAAGERRKQAEQALLQEPETLLTLEFEQLFFHREEADEIF